MKIYKSRPLLLIAAMMVLTACQPLTLPVSLGARNAEAPQLEVLPQPVAKGITVDGLTAIQTALEQIYERVNPSVVNIRVRQRVEASALAVPQIPGFPLFEPPLPEQPQPPQDFFREGAGSGFVWDKEGHIVTNNHVVDGADEITVTFWDGTVATAEIAGADPDTDLAVLKVEVATDLLHPVELVDSSSVRVGQLAAAIGNPFGLEGTMTVGFVSALGRSLPASLTELGGLRYTIPDIIQTDAPINPGNSGGILVNDEGKVIGVTAAIESPVGANAGIGFAIPSSLVSKVVPGLIENGYFDHPWLGISGTTLDPRLAEAMDLAAGQRGALVIDVLPASPADRAGLQGSDRQIEIDNQPARVGGDVIIAIDGQPVQKFEDLVAYLVEHTEVGQEIRLTVLRSGQERELSVRLAARPRSQSEGSVSSTRPPVSAWLGIRGLALTPELAGAMGLSQSQTGVLVQQVEAGSPADRAGIRGSYKPAEVNGQSILIGGDVILRADGQTIERVEDLQQILAGMQPGDTLSLMLLRDGRQMTVEVELSERPAQSP